MDRHHCRSACARHHAPAPYRSVTEEARALLPSADHGSFGEQRRVVRIVAEGYLVSFQSNRYSVPIGFSGQIPVRQGLDSFDFTYQPSIEKKQITTLASCHFIEHGENIVILGPPGVGKTHLGVGLGIRAIEAGYRVLFTTAAAMIAALTKAAAEGRLEDKLKFYTAPRLLIIDEIGYLPIEHHGAICSSN